jgi:hypothetical protein
LEPLKKNKSEIPIEFKENSKREVYSSLFAFTNNITLTSYVPKKGKAVCLISSMHTDSNIVESGQKKKPEIILYYNKNESGVDTFDQMVSNYSVRRKTKRWPLSVFYCMLDIASVNAFILFNVKNKTFINRRELIESLIKSLVMPQSVMRLKTPNLSYFTKQQIRSLYNILEPSEKRNKKSEKKLQKRVRCYNCRSDNNKTQTICNSCDNPICTMCQNIYCNDCDNKDVEEYYKF